MTTTQTERVFAALQDAPLTSAEAFTSLGVIHLPRRVKDLRDLGAIIDTEQVAGLNRYGTTCHWTVYKLSKASPLLDCFTKPTGKGKSKKPDLYLLGLMKSARILLDSADYESAKAALSREIRSRAKKKSA